MADGIVWRKARASGGQGGNCVEVAFSADGRAVGMVRDSKRPHDGHLTVTPLMLGALLTSVKAGHLDIPALRTRT